MSVQTFCIHASPTEQAQVAQVARQGKTPQKVARRARIVLMLANHQRPSPVAEVLHVSRMTVRVWAHRFVSDGVPGLLRDASPPRAPQTDHARAGAGRGGGDPDDAADGEHALE